jgi:predicted RNase H-like nuclease (RuvC/YqgF family)
MTILNEDLKQELDRLKAENADLKERIHKYWKECDRFENENSRFKEALIKIDNLPSNTDKDWDIIALDAVGIAREALKGAESC